MTLVDLRPGLRAYLLGDTDLSSAVGGERVYSILLPQGQKAASVVYSKISGIGEHHMQGPSGLARPRIQLDCYATDQDIAVALGGLVKGRIDGFRGEMPYGMDSPQASVTVLGVFFDMDREIYDDAAGLYRVSQDYLIWFSER
jgi:hypothetical protein